MAQLFRFLSRQCTDVFCVSFDFDFRFKFDVSGRATELDTRVQVWCEGWFVIPKDLIQGLFDWVLKLNGEQQPIQRRRCFKAISEYLSHIMVF